MSDSLPLMSGFPSPGDVSVDLLVIAGEHSGDEHAARMVSELKTLNPRLNVFALGGSQLAEAGAKVLYDMTRHSIVGFYEVLKYYGFFKDLFEKLVAWITEHKPQNICFVDYPGFNLRLAQRLYQEGICRKAGGRTGLYYYIGPQIWAWKAKRRFRMAQWLDALAVIFPFEVERYQDTSLPVTFVGHPFVTSDFEPVVSYNREGPILLLPGSRTIAISRIFPVMLEAFERFNVKHPEERALVIFPSSEIRTQLMSISDSWPRLKNKIEWVPVGQKVEGKIVLTSSGTMSLAVGLAGIPGAIAYRVHPFTYFWGRMVIDITYIGIGNLLLDEAVYPEYIQGRATPQRLLGELESAFEDSRKRQAAQAAANRLREILTSRDTASPGKWLAQAINQVT